MCSVTVIAIILSNCAVGLLKYFLSSKGSYWDAKRILSVTAAFFLLIYALYLFIDWSKQRKNEYQKTQNTENDNDNDIVNDKENSPSIELQSTKNDKNDKNGNKMNDIHVNNVEKMLNEQIQLTIVNNKNVTVKNDEEINDAVTSISLLIPKNNSCL